MYEQAMTASMLGLANVKIEPPSKDQRRLFPHVAANVSLDLLLKVDAIEGGVLPLHIKGMKVTRSTKPETLGQMTVLMPNWEFPGSRAPFYPVDRLHPLQVSYLVERFKAQEEKWKSVEEISDDMPISVSVQQPVAAAAE